MPEMSSALDRTYFDTAATGFLYSPEIYARVIDLVGADKIIFTRAKGTPRAAEPRDLHRQFSERSGKMSQAAASLPKALDLATQAVGRDDLICVTGSFYLVGEAKKHLTNLARKHQQP